MKIAICIDDKNGLGFNKRRQSRDRLLIENLIASADGGKIFISSYSAPLFADFPDKIEVRDDFLEAAGDSDICFVEDRDITPYADRIDYIILYRWNRHYPADRWLELDISQYSLVSSVEFAGSSHDLITREDLTR